MSRYVDADALKTDILKKYKQNWEVPCSYEDRIIQRVVTDLRVLIEQNTPADVVPKSEVAREIFEEIAKQVASKIPMRIQPIFKNDMDFEDGFRNGKSDAFIEVLMIIAELKKKYTEDKG